MRILTVKSRTKATSHRVEVDDFGAVVECSCLVFSYNRDCRTVSEMEELMATYVDNDPLNPKKDAGMRLWPRMVYELRGAKDCVQYGRLSFISEAKFLIVASNGALPEPVSIDSKLVRNPLKSIQDNTRHEWEQSVGGMGEILKRFMKRPGMVLCDPFLGSGTTFEAAKAYKPSRMIGCDIDAEHCRKAEDRLHGRSSSAEPNLV